MTVGLTTTQWENTSGTSTRPVRLLRIEHAGYLELLSEVGSMNFNSELFSAGGVMSMSVDDGRSATLTFSATTTRIAESVNGRWRNGKICQIYAITGLPDDDDVYTLEEGILLLDGVIDSSDYSNGVVTVRAIHKSLRGKLTPRQTFNAYSEYLPNPGTIVGSGSEAYALKSRR